MAPTARTANDEKFLRTQSGKTMRGRYWQSSRDGSLINKQEDEYPRDEVDLLV